MSTGGEKSDTTAMFIYKTRLLSSTINTGTHTDNMNVFILGWTICRDLIGEARNPVTFDQL